MDWHEFLFLFYVAKVLLMFPFELRFGVVDVNLAACHTPEKKEEWVKKKMKTNRKTYFNEKVNISTLVAIEFSHFFSSLFVYAFEPFLLFNHWNISS